MRTAIGFRDILSVAEAATVPIEDRAVQRTRTLEVPEAVHRGLLGAAGARPNEA